MTERQLTDGISVSSAEKEALLKPLPTVGTDKWSLFCPHCESEKQYNIKYDAYYCELCNIWLEEKCSDPGCNFCFIRPEKPSQAI